MSFVRSQGDNNRSAAKEEAAGVAQIDEDKTLIERVIVQTLPSNGIEKINLM